MTHQLDLIGICLDEASTGRIGLPQARDVRRPRLATNAVAGESVKPPHRQRGVVAPPLVDVPRAASADPDTSHLAAARMRSTGALMEQQQLVLDWVKRWPGLTSAELAAEYAKVIGGVWQQHRPMFGRRLGELAKVHIRRGDPRDCRITGSPCTTWWPV